MMQANQTETHHNTRQCPQDAWKHSEMLFLLTCYDVWSATPPRGCACGDPVPAAAQS